MNITSPRAPISVPLALMIALTALLSLLCVILERVLGLSGGYVSLVILLVPTVLAAVGPRAQTGFVVAGVAAAACAVAGWLGPLHRQEPIMTPQMWLMPLVGAGALLTVGLGLGLWSAYVHRRLAEQTERADRLARLVYEMTRQGDTDAAARPDSARAEPPEPAPTAPVEYSTLLLKVQDIGKAITGALDMDSLLCLIPETATKLVGASRCELYLLDDTGRWLLGQHGGRPMRLAADTGMFGWVLRNRQVLTRDYALADYNLCSLMDQQPVECFAAVPLAVGRENLGVLNVVEVAQPPAEFDRLLRILANFSSLALRNARLFQRIEDMARRDGLTGLLNHATFQAALTQTVDQTVHGGGSCAVMLVDVDHFKKFNDTYGHQAGDYVLQQIAAGLQAVAPDGAAVARYGGEEFVMVLPDRTADQARAVADQFRARLAQMPLCYDGRPLRVTASVGVAACPAHARQAAALVQAADEALYAAKKAGRNRVVIADELLAAAG